MPRVLIIDYGLGNIDSVRRAFEDCGAEVIVSREEEDFSAATHIILPGVGSFPEGMERLNKYGIPDILQKNVVEEGVPLLGICLGMQLLATAGEEVRPSKGLGLIPGKVIQLAVKQVEERIPHVGWNSVEPVKETSLFEGIPFGKDFYFVHSFHFDCEREENVVARTPYCGSFVSVVNAGNIWGTQFHPEKSQRVGMQLLKNFLLL